jgi:hypothetical protein
MRIEELIRKNANEYGLIGSEYIIRVQNNKDDELEVYVRPSDRNGDTENFIIKDNIFFSLNYIKK